MHDQDALGSQMCGHSVVHDEKIPSTSTCCLLLLSDITRQEIDIGIHSLLLYSSIPLLFLFLCFFFGGYVISECERDFFFFPDGTDASGLAVSDDIKCCVRW